MPPCQADSSTSIGNVSTTPPVRRVHNWLVTADSVGDKHSAASGNIVNEKRSWTAYSGRSPGYRKSAENRPFNTSGSCLIIVSASTSYGRRLCNVSHHSGRVRLARGSHRRSAYRTGTTLGIARRRECVIDVPFAGRNRCRVETETPHTLGHSWRRRNFAAVGS